MTMVGTGGSATAVRRSPERGDVTRAELAAHVESVAGSVAGPALAGVLGRDADPASVWVSVRDPYLTVVAVLGCLRGASAALVDADGPANMLDTLAAVCPPALVVCDDADASVARWARGRDRRVHVVDRDWVHGGQPAVRMPPPRGDVVLRFFTSGTTGTPKCVGIGAAQLVAAVRGVAERLTLTPADTSLSIAPLNHVLGLVTSVLVALSSGGAVAFADPRRPRELFATLTRARPTWCPASPSAHRLVHTLLRGAGRTWPGLRLIRSASAPIADSLVARLESDYSVPVINAYAMTEAPGEIASEAPDRDRRRGTVGKPTLCEVDIRSDGESAPPGSAGEIWIRGPNVVSRGASWFPTGDIGSLDDAGFLRVTGRRDDVINQGGHKIWPPDVEAVALTDPSVDAAVAFPIPHDGLGETVGLAVVPGAGRDVDRGALRRRLMSALPRHAWPSTIVVCAQIPVSPRGKIQRSRMWGLLSDVRARVDT